MLIFVCALKLAPAERVLTHSSVSTAHVRLTTRRAGFVTTAERQGELRRAERRRKSQSGWQACSWAARRNASGREAWGGRLRREQTAGMLNYHTSEHDMSSSLTTARRLGVESGRSRRGSFFGSVWSRWFKRERDDNRATLMFFFIKYVISRLRADWGSC